MILEIAMPRDDLAPEHRETAPLLKAWTSYAPSEFQTTVSMRPSREESGTHVAPAFEATVSVPFPSGNVPLHSSIYLQLLVHSPNSRDVPCERPAGTARFHLQPLVESHLRGKNISLPVQTKDVVDDRGRPFTKTKFLVKKTTFVPELVDGDPGMSFDPLRPYDVHFLNGTYMDRVLRVAVGADMFPFVGGPDAWESRGPPLQASDPHTGNLQFPFWVTESVNLPGPFFWTIKKGPVPDERIVLHHLRIALQRAEFSEELFNGTVEKQMKVTGDEYDPVFTECCSLAMDASMVWATAMPYIADKLYGRKNDGTGWADLPVENFGWGTRSNDCDGLARQIYRMALAVRDGEFAHRTTLNLQRIHRLYVTFGMLGSVSAPKVEDSSANSSLPIGRDFGAEAFGAATESGSGTRFGNAVVDSDEDRKANRGGHAWVEALPLARFLKLVSRCEGRAGERNPSAEDQEERYVPGSLRPEGLAEWNEKMPHMIGEGTGRMHPLQLPPGEYANGDEELRESYEEGRAGYLEAARGAFDALEGVMGEAKASMRQYQTMVRDVPDTRLSRFYVKAKDAYTDRFMHKDSARTCWFTWMNTSPRVPDAEEEAGEDREDELSVLRAELDAPSPRSARAGRRSEGTHRKWWEFVMGTEKRGVSGWNYGCNLRDRLHGTSGRKYVGLMAHPPYGVPVLKMARAAERHLPPDVPLELPADMEPGDEGELPEHLMFFNEGAATWKELDSASRERWEGKTPERILFYAPLSYVTPSVAGRLSEVVKNSKNISGARAVREVVSADADLVRFEIDWIADSDDVGGRMSEGTGFGARPDRHPEHNEIVVSGEHTIRSDPDAALIYLSVQSEKRDARDAEKVVRTVYDRAITRGIMKKFPGLKVESSSYDISPVVVYRSEQKPQRVGFKATQRVTLVTRDLSIVGDVVQEAAVSGGNELRVDGVRFVLRDDDEAVGMEALRLATENAMEKVKVIADAAGVSTWTVAEVKEVGSSRYRSVRREPAAMEEAAPASDAPSTNLSPGVIETRKAVRVTVLI